MTLGFSAEHPLSALKANAGAPLYTVYAAPTERSQYLVDEGYRLVYHRMDQPLSFVTDTAGLLEFGWRRGRETAVRLADYHRPPMITRSFADSGRLVYSPFEGIEVTHSFAVHSSRFLVLELAIRNRSPMHQRIDLSTSFQLSGGIEALDPSSSEDAIFFRHTEPKERWSETRLKNYKGQFENVLLTRPQYEAFQAGFESRVVNPEILAVETGKKNQKKKRPTSFVVEHVVEIPRDRTRVVRFVRGVDPQSKTLVWLEAEKLINELSFAEIYQAAEGRYSRIPQLSFANLEEEMLYWQAFTLAEQMMMPPEGESSHNYYVFSREPTWGWGHDGQVFHESLAMLAYVHMNPQAAMDSQRVYIERQQPSGYIPYRVGPYVTRDFLVKGRQTSSAPFFSWTNWEIFKVSADVTFLEEAYESSRRYVEYLLATRDRDGDGLFEWGGNAVLECVRDGFNVVWDLLGQKPDSPSRVEALDLNCMLVREMSALAEMAQQLNRSGEAGRWRRKGGELADRINRVMWDPETRFYYHVDRDTNAFSTVKGIDLRRMEIIGLLPLWAGIVPQERLGSLIRHLKDPNKFWRSYGVPTLAADDPFYNPVVDRCCKWNGPVWVQWNYLVFRGLLESGLRAEAEELARRSYAGALAQLKKNHLFWESYSPDQTEIRTYAPYIWNAVLARMMIDLSE